MKENDWPVSVTALLVCSECHVAFHDRADKCPACGNAVKAGRVMDETAERRWNE